MVQKQNTTLDGSKWSDEDIVISGISGRFPNCDSVNEFQEKLLAGEDLICDEPRRFQKGLYGAITRYGMVKDLSRFDAEFFNIHPKQAERMDPQVRGLLEVAYEAIVDAGLHPDDLRGSRTGVVVGVASSETQDKWSQQPRRINGYEYTGCTRTMFANRVSYMFDLKGPSYSIDTASSTTLVAFQQAYAMIMDEVCDAVLVCGTDLVLNPCVCLMFQCLNMLSPEGKCKAFDMSGDGYVRSEGIIAVLLQRAKNSKRVYARALAAGSNCDGYKDDGITFPSGEQQVKLFRRVANMAGIDTTTLDFMEAHGSATRVGDPQEMNAVTEVFVKNRKIPLMTGSIKSNMGHGEPASALSAVVKVCVAMHCGIIPPNLHFKNPNKDIPALLNGSLQVITKPTPWAGGLVAVNSFGVGGANGHALLLSNNKSKVVTSDPFARLVVVSGVNESAVQFMINKIQTLPRDPEFYALLNNVYRKNIRGHKVRGYLLIDNEEKAFQIQKAGNPGRGTCLVLPGFSKPTKIDKELLNIPIFAKTLQQLQNSIQGVNKNINLSEILQSQKNYDYAQSFVGFVAFQIALLDLLSALEIKPNYIIGINAGEIAAGYADNQYTAEQAVLIAYNVGTILQNSKLQSAATAEIGVAFDSEKCVLPLDIVVTAHNSPNSTFVSGPESSIANFVKTKQSQGIKASVVEPFGFYINNQFNKNEFNRIKLPFSLNAPSKLLTQNASSDNNQFNDLVERILSPAYFQEAVAKLPQDVAIVEVGSKSYLDNVLKPFNDYYALFDQNQKYNPFNFLQGIGKLYNGGLQPQVQNLYAPVSYPVSNGTPMIQSLIEWDHSRKWNVVFFGAKDAATAGEINTVVDFNKKEFSVIPGVYVNKKQIFPKGCYIELVWQAMSKLQTKPVRELPIVMENIHFLRDTIIPDDGPLTFSINILSGSQKFEIWESNEIVVTGTVRLSNEITKERIPASIKPEPLPNVAGNEVPVVQSQIYRDLKVKRYDYTEIFQSINSYDYANRRAKLEWKGHLGAFIESIFQIGLLQENSYDNAGYPDLKQIRKIVFQHHDEKSENGIYFQYYKQFSALQGRDIEVRGIKFGPSATEAQANVVTETYNFSPFISNDDNPKALETVIHFALENSLNSEIKVSEIAGYKSVQQLIAPKFRSVNPRAKVGITIYTSDSDLKPAIEGIEYVTKDIKTSAVDASDIVIASNVFTDEESITNVISSTKENGLILLQEEYPINENDVEPLGLKFISSFTNKSKSYTLLKKVSKQAYKTEVIQVNGDNANWILKVKQAIVKPDVEVLIVGKIEYASQILNTFRCVRFEVNEDRIRVVLLDEKSGEFSLSNPSFSNQVNKRFPVNILINGEWGILTSVPIPENVTIPAENAFVEYKISANNANLSYVQQQVHNKNNIQPYEDVCDVYYAAVNTEKSSFAGFSGKNSKGEKVAGLLPYGKLESSIAIDKDLFWNVPEGYNLEQAAYLALPYALAYYGLVIRGNIQNGDNLIVSGFNDITTAAISVALSKNIIPYVQVSNDRQKTFFKLIFPQLNDNSIIVGNKNINLHILRSTEGKGVDIAFNTSPDNNNLREYVTAISAHGRFVFFENEGPFEDVIGSGVNTRNIAFHRITQNAIFHQANVPVREKIKELAQNGFKNGSVKILPVSVYNAQNFQEAFKPEESLLQSRIVLKVKEENEKYVNASPRTYFDQQKSYIVFGNLTGFDLFAVNWMIQKGVKNLVLVNTTGNEGELASFYLSLWKNNGVNVQVITASKFSEKDCENIIKNSSKSAPVGGIFDYTGFGDPVANDFQELSNTEFEDVGKIRIQFLKNMDKVSRSLCPNLEYFVAFSSFLYAMGTPGYSKYSYANGVVQGIIKNRTAQKLPAIAILLGPVGQDNQQLEYNVGVPADNLQPQSISSALEVLDKALQLGFNITTTYVYSESTSTASSGDDNYKAMLEGVARFLGIKDPSSILPNLTLLDLGLDSLITTDIQQFLEEKYNLVLDTQQVREITFSSLKELAQSLV